ncbi:MAG: shikimate dehydrogenase [Burkholderiales bacterium]|nr:shikimate dehydrogenase [Burkholderiales bacterium]
MPDQYAVIGNPVAHSKSPLIHAAFARQTGQDLVYERLLAPKDAFVATANAFRARGGRGLNVTLPFKGEAFRYATVLSERARSAQAVNTLKFDGDVIFADNTDGAGLVNDLVRNLGCVIAGRRILLMGAGGAASGVIEPLLQQQPAQFALANRTPEKTQSLAQSFRGALEAVSYSALAGRQFDLVVNATSASLAGELPQLPPGVFARGALAYDMMYGRGETPFLAFARSEGAAQLADGLGMLVEQAAESFYIWRGLRPDSAPVLQQLRQMKDD